MVFLGTHVPPPPHFITSNRTSFEEVYLRIFLTHIGFGMIFNLTSAHYTLSHNI